MDGQAPKQAGGTVRASWATPAVHARLQLHPGMTDLLGRDFRGVLHALLDARPQLRPARLDPVAERRPRLSTWGMGVLLGCGSA